MGMPQDEVIHSINTAKAEQTKEAATNAAAPATNADAGSAPVAAPTTPDTAAKVA